MNRQVFLRNPYIEIIMRTFEKCHCTVTHSSDRLYQQNLRMILSALQSMWLLMQRLKSWQQRLRLWTLRTVNKIECIERLFTRKSVISFLTLFKDEESSSCARLNRTWAWQIVIKLTSVRFIIWCLSEINSQLICFCQFISEVLKIKQSFMTWLRFARTMIEWHITSICNLSWVIVCHLNVHFKLTDLFTLNTFVNVADHGF